MSDMEQNEEQSLTNDSQICDEIAERLRASLTHYLGKLPTPQSVSAFCEHLCPDGWDDETRTIFKTAMLVSHCLESAHSLEPLLKSASDKILEQVGELHIPIPFRECEIMRRQGMLMDWYVSSENDTKLGKDVYYVVIPKHKISFIKINMELDLGDQKLPATSDL